jgi:hypothetical protein
MEWLRVLVLIALLLGPIAWVFIRERRSTGAPSREDQLNQTGIAGELRNKHRPRSGRLPAAQTRPTNIA